MNLLADWKKMTDEVFAASLDRILGLSERDLIEVQRQTINEVLEALPYLRQALEDRPAGLKTLDKLETLCSRAWDFRRKVYQKY